MALEDRPQYQHGVGTIGGQSFHWGSGMPGKYWSIPYGDYPVTPNAPTGDWAHRAGAIPIANNVIPDPQLGRNRIGIMIHSGSAASLDQLYTEGCFKVDPDDWPAVRSEILKEASNGPLYLHVQPGGVASFTSAATLQPVASVPTANNATAPPVTPSGSPGPSATSAASAPTDSPAAQHEAFIRDYAAKIGVNPDLAVGIARAEGMNSTGFRTPNQASTVDVSGGKPFSFGDFQLNVKGGMGADALKAGIDPADAAQWQKADMYALDRMKSGGIAPWTDPFARQWTASGKPITGGTTLTTTPPGVVDPSIVAHGGTSPPLPATDGSTPATTVATAPAPPTFGQAIASGDVGGALKAALTKPPTTDAKGNQVEGKSPLEKLAGAVGDVAEKPAPAPAPIQQAMPAQDPDPGLAPAASQLFQTVAQSAARPLSWSSAPYGANAGLIRPGGTTLNATGYGGAYG